MMGPFWRYAIALGAAVLAGCSGGEEQGQAGAEPGSSRTAAANDGRDAGFACALDGAAGFSEDCTVQRVLVEGVQVLVVHHPDGGFRRFEIVDDGYGIITADGAHEVRRSLSDDVLEVAVGKDRYRFPVTLTENASRP